jgi:uncharacterized membrane protein
MAPLTPELDAQNNKIMAILCYIGILFLIPVATGDYKRSPFVKFHLNQGVLVCGLGLTISIIWGVLLGILWAVIPGYNYSGRAVASFLSSLVFLVPLALAIYGIVNAATGKMRELPVIGKLFTVFK